MTHRSSSSRISSTRRWFVEALQGRAVDMIGHPLQPAGAARADRRRRATPGPVPAAGWGRCCRRPSGGCGPASPPGMEQAATCASPVGWISSLQWPPSRGGSSSTIASCCSSLADPAGGPGAPADPPRPPGCAARRGGPYGLAQHGCRAARCRSKASRPRHRRTRGDSDGRVGRPGPWRRWRRWPDLSCPFPASAPAPTQAPVPRASPSLAQAPLARPSRSAFLLAAWQPSC